MTIRWDPKIKAPSGVSSTSEGDNSARPATNGKSTPPAAMEKPASVAQPDAAATHPLRQAPMRKAHLFTKELAKLREMMKSQHADKLAAGKQALALAASYPMRRSRGARRMAIELCEDIAKDVEELEELANKLAVVLTAEGDLHEVSAEATLRACATLARLFGHEDEA